MGREERGRPEWGERREPQEARCPVGRALNTGESGRICKETGKGSKLPCASFKLPSPQGPSSPDQAAYLRGKEAFGSVFAQGREATRPRTLTCTDGLLSCCQNFIQFV